MKLELHIYNPQHKLVAYLKEKGIQPQAYSPLGSQGSPLLQDATVKSLAEKHGEQPVGILLAYLRASSSLLFGIMDSYLDLSFVKSVKKDIVALLIVELI